MPYTGIFVVDPPDDTVAHNFDGVDDYIDTALRIWDGTSVSQGGSAPSWSVSFQLMLQTTGSTQLIMGTNSSGASQGIKIYVTGYEIYYGGTTNNVNAWRNGIWGEAEGENDWFQVGVSFNTNTGEIRVYKNGAFEATRTLSAPGSPVLSDAIFGGRRINVVLIDPFPGKLRRYALEVGRVWSDQEFIDFQNGAATPSTVDVLYETNDLLVQSGLDYIVNNRGSGANGTAKNIDFDTFYETQSTDPPQPFQGDPLDVKPSDSDLNPATWVSDAIAGAQRFTSGVWEWTTLVTGKSYLVFKRAGPVPASTDEILGQIPDGGLVPQIDATTLNTNSTTSDTNTRTKALEPQVADIDTRTMGIQSVTSSTNIELGKVPRADVTVDAGAEVTRTLAPDPTQTELAETLSSNVDINLVPAAARNDFTNAFWTASRFTASTGAVLETAEDNTHELTATYPSVNGQQFTIGFEVKGQNASRVVIGAGPDDTYRNNMRLDQLNGDNGGSNVAMVKGDLGDGWYKIRLIFTAQADNATYGIFGCQDSFTDRTIESYLGIVTRGYDLRNAFFAAGSHPA